MIGTQNMVKERFLDAVQETKARFFCGRSWKWDGLKSICSFESSVARRTIELNT